MPGCARIAARGCGPAVTRMRGRAPRCAGRAPLGPWAASATKSSGELRRALHKVTGADPETLKAAERGAGALQILCADGGLRQHLGMALMHRGQPVAQSDALFGQAYMDRAPVVQRALLRQIPVLDHFFDVVRNVGAEITAPQCELADRHLRVAD